MHFNLFLEKNENCRGGPFFYEVIGYWTWKCQNLTEAICIGWVQDSLGTEGVASLESGLTNNLDEQETPTHAAGVPWSTSG